MPWIAVTHTCSSIEVCVFLCLSVFPSNSSRLHDPDSLCARSSSIIERHELSIVDKTAIRLLDAVGLSQTAKVQPKLQTKINAKHMSYIVSHRGTIPVTQVCRYCQEKEGVKGEGEGLRLLLNSNNLVNIIYLSIPHHLSQFLVGSCLLVVLHRTGSICTVPSKQDMPAKMVHIYTRREAFRDSLWPDR